MTVKAVPYRELLTTYLGPQWRDVGLLAVLILAGIGLQLVGPQILGQFVDATQTGATAQDLLTKAGTFLTVTAAGQAVALAVTYLSGNVGWRATNHLRTDLAAHCLDLDVGFHKAYTPGELIERIDGDVGMLAEFFSNMVVEVIGNSLLGIGVLAALYVVDWRVGLVGLGYAAGVSLTIRVLQRPATQAWENNRKRETALFGFLGEHLYGMEDIRGNGAGAHTMYRLHHLMNDVAAGRLRAKAMQSLQSNLTNLVSAIAQVGVLALSTWLLIRGQTTLGTVFLTINYLALLKQPVTRIQRRAGELQRATAGIRRITALLRTPSRVRSTGTQELPAGPMTVAFENVSFHYRNQGSEPKTPNSKADDDAWALHDISFDLAPGQVLGLLGRTGSGKSTITRLLFRLHDPDDGTIRINGVDHRTVPLNTLRRRIGLVTQDVQLFRATLRDNLTLFNPGISDTRLLAALESLGLMPWVASLPDGLDTKLQPGTEGLSAGESQLLDLARVFLKNPDMVILDEASARIDPATERLLDKAISGLIENRTTIIIAHRLSTVARADSIMILDQGSVIEFGEKSTLTKESNSRFRRLIEADLQEAPA